MQVATKVTVVSFLEYMWGALVGRPLCTIPAWLEVLFLRQAGNKPTSNRKTFTLYQLIHKTTDGIYSEVQIVYIYNEV